MNRILALIIPALLAGLPALRSARAEAAPATVIIVTGAAGEKKFADEFTRQAGQWRDAAARGSAHVHSIGTEGDGSGDVRDLQSLVAAEAPSGTAPLWIVLIGHGTWDGRNARFNLRGPDFADADLADWLKPAKRPCIIVHTGSCSAPFLTKLSAPGRIVLTATRSGSEQNRTRFGTWLADSLTSTEADIDSNGSVSVLEAWLFASRRTTEFYRSENRLATEHALLDDNGDSLGTPADWFRGLRSVRKPDTAAAPDGSLARRTFLIPPAGESKWSAEQTKERESLEARVEALRETKASMKEDDYYSRLEELLEKLAELTKNAETGGRQ